MGAIPVENVTAAAAGSRTDRLLGRVSPLLDRLPGRTADRAVPAVRRRLQREQRQRAPLTPAERAALLPSFLDDIALLESVTGLHLDHWRALDTHERPPLDVRGNIGTAHTDIDRPL